MRSWADKLGSFGEWGWSGLRTAMANASKQKVGTWLHLQDNFEWRNVAAAAMGSMYSAPVARGSGGRMRGLNLGFGEFGKSLAVGAISGFAGGLMTAVMKGGKFDVIQVATDAFGNALGGSLTAAIAAPSNAPSEYELREQERQQEQARGAVGQEPRPQEELRDTSTAAPMGMDEELGQAAGGGPLGLLRSMVLGAAGSGSSADGTRGSEWTDLELTSERGLHGRGVERRSASQLCRGWHTAQERRHPRLDRRWRVAG